MYFKGTLFVNSAPLIPAQMPFNKRIALSFQWTPCRKVA